MVNKNTEIRFMKVFDYSLKVLFFLILCFNEYLKITHVFNRYNNTPPRALFLRTLGHVYRYTPFFSDEEYLDRMSIASDVDHRLSVVDRHKWELDVVALNN